MCIVDCLVLFIFQIGLIDKINNIYTGTSFDKCGTGFGFQVKEVPAELLFSVYSQYNFAFDANRWATYQ